MRKWLVIFIGVIAFVACQKHYEPKPKGFLALTYPPHQYEKVDIGCPYTFKKNKIAIIKPSYLHDPCRIDIVYPKMAGTIYLTYKPVKKNLIKLLKDAQKMPLKHTIKADQIIGDAYINKKHHTYGMLYTITGNAASQAQFYLTDSTRHFMLGAIYFKRLPNYDSIYPAAQYLIQDMKKLMESLQWKSNK